MWLPSAAQRATVPAQLNSASSGCAKMTAIRSRSRRLRRRFGLHRRRERFGVDRRRRLARRAACRHVFIALHACFDLPCRPASLLLRAIVRCIPSPPMTRREARERVEQSSSRARPSGASVIPTQDAFVLSPLAFVPPSRCGTIAICRGSDPCRWLARSRMPFVPPEVACRMNQSSMPAPISGEEVRRRFVEFFEERGHQRSARRRRWCRTTIRPCC